MNQVFLYLERQSGLAYGNDMFNTITHSDLSEDALPFCHKVFLNTILDTMMVEIENLSCQDIKSKKSQIQKISSMQNSLNKYIMTLISCFSTTGEYAIDESKEYWEQSKYLHLISYQKTTISWVIDFFIKVMTSGDQSKK